MAQRRKQRRGVNTVIEADVAMHRDARAKSVTCAEFWWIEAFKHADRVTLTEYHEDGSETKRLRSDCR